MDNEKIGKKNTVKGIGAVIIIGIAVFLYWVTGLFFSEKQNYSYDNITSYGINLENAEAVFTVSMGDGNYTDIEVTTSGFGVKSSLSLEENEGVLDILQSPQSNFIPNIGGSVKVYIRATVDSEDAINEFALSTKSGRIKIDGVNAYQIDVGSHSGEIQLSDTTSHELAVTTHSGEIKLENIRTNYLENTSESGRCTVNFSSDLKQLNAFSKSESGAVSYVFHNDIPLNISWAAKNFTSDIENTEESPNKVFFEAESGQISIIRSYQ